MDQIVREYIQGRPLREIARLHYVGYQTVIRRLKSMNVEIKSNRRIWQVTNIIKEWNTGMALREIVRIHNMDNVGTLLIKVQKWRAKGWEFMPRPDEHLEG